MNKFRIGDIVTCIDRVDFDDLLQIGNQYEVKNAFEAYGGQYITINVNRHRQESRCEFRFTLYIKSIKLPEDLFTI